MNVVITFSHPLHGDVIVVVETSDAPVMLALVGTLLLPRFTGLGGEIVGFDVVFVVFCTGTCTNVPINRPNDSSIRTPSDKRTLYI